MHFLTELQKTEVSVTLLKSHSTTDTLTAIFIILGTNKQTKEALAVKSVFGIHSYTWVDWTALIS